jgi:Flp pilus assembly pilin Flp
MRIVHPSRSPSRPQRGQAMVEYAVIGMVLAAALFFFEFNGKTGAQYLTDMIRGFFRNLTYFISLP